MKYFCEISASMQILLLITSLLTMISLAVGIVILMRRRTNPVLQIVTWLVLILNMGLYVVMQLNNRMVYGTEQDFLHVRHHFLWMVLVASWLIYGAIIVSEVRLRRSITRDSIKEAFDNLPTGVCFFNESGLAVLCNRAMYRFSFAACGKDVQFVADLEECLEQGFVPAAGARREGNLFMLPDGSAWQLEKRQITREHGERYVQYIAADVTDLQQNRVELMFENEQLRRVQAELKKLSANVIAVTREEEILNTKMRVHDEMGRCLLEAQRYLKENRGEGIPEEVALSWKRAVSMVKYNNESPDEDMLLQIRRACESVNLTFLQKGDLPKRRDVGYIFTCAIRECVTNAVRYARAKELYAVFDETDAEATVRVTNNGIAPKEEISEGGGLSTLRRRVERAGGTMVIRSKPYFELTITVPKGGVF